MLELYLIFGIAWSILVTFKLARQFTAFKADPELTKEHHTGAQQALDEFKSILQKLPNTLSALVISISIVIVFIAISFCWPVHMIVYISRRIK